MKGHLQSLQKSVTMLHRFINGIYTHDHHHYCIQNQSLNCYNKLLKLFSLEVKVEIFWSS